jgi:hypothetical protein
MEWKISLIVSMPLIHCNGKSKAGNASAARSQNPEARSNACLAALSPSGF